MTPRRIEIMTMIRDGQAKNGYPPTLQEIADVIGISKITVFEHVAMLVRNGLVAKGAKNSARNLRLTTAGEEALPSKRKKCPHCGKILLIPCR